MAYNMTPHNTTGFSPFYLLHKRTPKTPLASLVVPPEQLSVADAVAKGEQEKARVTLEAQSRLAHARVLQDKKLIEKAKVDPRRRFRAGDLVWVFDEKANGKLQLRFGGIHFRVVGQVAKNVYKLERNGKVLPRGFHGRRIVLYKADIDPFKISVAADAGSGLAALPQLAPAQAAPRMPALVVNPIPRLPEAPAVQAVPRAPEPPAAVEAPQQPVAVPQPVPAGPPVTLELLREDEHPTVRMLAEKATHFWDTFSVQENKPARGSAREVADYVDSQLSSDRNKLIGLITGQLRANETREQRVVKIAEWIDSNRNVLPDKR